MDVLRIAASRSPGGEFSFNISTSDVRVVGCLCVTTLGIGALYFGYKLYQTKINGAVNRAVGGQRDDQGNPNIRPGSLIVDLHCFTDERFLELLEECENGTLKDRLEKEFYEIGLRIQEMKVQILNIEEVNKTKEAILARMQTKVDVESDVETTKMELKNLEISTTRLEGIRNFKSLECAQMGIRRLTQYVEELPSGEGKVWDNFDLRETKVVIDGNGLYHYIYSDICDLNTKYGGQYGEFQEKVKEFFENLRSNNVEPYVVIDGIMSRDEKKLETHIDRKTKRIKRTEAMWKSNGRNNEKVFPRLLHLVFAQVLREMKVHYAVADFEADCEIASLANELDAPVMGSDSDFYIFKIKHGYIPFQQYDFTGQNTQVKKFSFIGFARHLAIDPEMLPLLASLVGNDYISDSMLTKFDTHIRQLVRSSHLDAGEKVPVIAQFLSKHRSMSEACKAVISLYQNSAESEFVEKLPLSIKEYQIERSNLIGYFVSRSLSCNVSTYNGCSLPQWVVKLYREGLIASEGLDCLCNRKIFLRPQSEDVSLPSTQICAEVLRRYYYKLALNLETQTPGCPKGYENTSSPLAVLEKLMIYREIYHTQFKTTSYGTTPSTSFVKQDHNTTTLESEFAHKVNVGENAMKSRETGLPSKWNESIQDIKVDKTENPPQAASNSVKYANFTDSITVIEFDRIGSTLAEKVVNLTPQTEPQIHDIPKMSNATKQRQLLWLLYSDLPSICGLPIEHQLVASALRYWALNSQGLEPAHLAALLVYYVGEKRSVTTSESFQVTIQAVHGFSQWQNVLYWVERLNALFSFPFPTPELVMLYDGVHVCWLYQRLEKEGIWFADNIVNDKTLYRNLYERITNDLGSDWQI